MDHIIVGALLLMLAVIVSGWTARALPWAIPLPLLQIGFGVLIATLSDHGLGLDPQAFFLLFLPPLLFLDGWRIPKDGLFQDMRTITGLALGLVVFSVLGIGLLLHWMIPSMPLPVAFALAAILSPTDPTAIGAIVKRTPLPRRLRHILEGESLLNDASGLVCMRFAVSAVLTGSFSPASAVLTFLWLALAGIAVGVGTTWGVTTVQSRIAWRLGEEPGSKILMSLLLPFGAYLAAEQVHASGILAAVAAGITMSYAEQTGRALPITRMRRVAVWDMLQLALNGAMFVLLGEQLPTIAASADEAMREAAISKPMILSLYIVTVTVALIALRYAWVWVTFRFILFRRRLAGAPEITPPRRLLLLTSIAGVRGSITLGGVLTLPLMAHGQPFPGRDLAIFIAAGAVILSIALAGILLPRLLDGLVLPPEPDRERLERRARKAAALAAISAIEQAQPDQAGVTQMAVTRMEAAARISGDYRARIAGFQKTGDEAEQMRRTEAIDHELRLIALRAERETYFRLGRDGRVPDDMIRRLVSEIDHAETRITVDD